MNKVLIMVLAIVLSVVFSAAQLSWGLTKPKQASPPEQEQTDPQPSLPEERSKGLGRIIMRLDPDAKQEGSFWTFMVEGRKVTLIYDTHADRMRLVVPVAELASLKEGRLLRLMQANFDSALDARYAVSHGMLWGVFIHPLSSLTDRNFLSGIGQTVNVALTYGTSYSSGKFVFGGGDSQAIQRRKLIEELQKKGQGV